MNEMREELKRLCTKLNRLEIGYTADAITDIREVLYDLIGFVEKIAPEDKTND